MNARKKTRADAAEQRLTAVERAELEKMVAANCSLRDLMAWCESHGAPVGLATASRMHARLRAAADRILKRNAAIDVVRRSAAKAGVTLTQAALEQGAIAVGDILDGGADPASEEGQKLLLAGLAALTSVRAVEVADKRVNIARDQVRLQRDRIEVLTCGKFLEWLKDRRALEIAEGRGTNAAKIAALRQTFFADVDALEKSGEVKLPQ